MKRTIVYIDGFNLYYGALKGTNFKWLDVKKLSQNILDKDHDVIGIKYFTSMISGSDNQSSLSRQRIYIEALKKSIPELSIHYGKFMTHMKRALPANPKYERETILIKNTEEKGTDVNLAIHLLNDAWLNAYDSALLISNDSDFVEAIKIVNEERHKVVGVAIPSKLKSSRNLIKVASFTQKITPRVLQNSQLPAKIKGTNLHRPQKWTRKYHTH